MIYYIVFSYLIVLGASLEQKIIWYNAILAPIVLPMYVGKLLHRLYKHL